MKRHVILPRFCYFLFRVSKLRNNGMLIIHFIHPDISWKMEFSENVYLINKGIPMTEVISNSVVCLMPPTSSKKGLKKRIDNFHLYLRDKVFKNGPSKICGRQPLKNFTSSIVEYLDPFILRSLFPKRLWVLLIIV